MNGIICFSVRFAIIHCSQRAHHVNPRRFGVNITSTRRRPNFDEFPRHFRVLFRCNFAGRKIHVISTHFFLCNFDGRKIYVFSTYFVWCNLSGRNMHVVFTYFFRRNSELMKTFEKVFPVFATLNSWLLQDVLFKFFK